MKRAILGVLLLLVLLSPFMFPRTELNLVTDVWQMISMWLHATLFKIGAIPITTLGVLEALIIILLAFTVSKLARRALKNFSVRQEIAKATYYTLARLAHYCILMVGILMALASLGLDFTSVTLIAGALSFGIGFGLQSIINNFISGLIILFEQNLKVGDTIELQSGSQGSVTEINVRTTVIRTPDGIEIVVPNSELIGNKLTNLTMSDAYVRHHIPFKVAYGTDKNAVVKAVLEAAEKVPYTVKQHESYANPMVSITSLGESGFHFELVVWVAPAVKPRSVISDYLWQIHDSFDRNGIKLPSSVTEVLIKREEEREVQ